MAMGLWMIPTLEEVRLVNLPSVHAECCDINTFFAAQSDLEVDVFWRWEAWIIGQTCCNGKIVFATSWLTKRSKWMLSVTMVHIFFFKLNWLVELIVGSMLEMMQWWFWEKEEGYRVPRWWWWWWWWWRWSMIHSNFFQCFAVPSFRGKSDLFFCFDL